MPSNTMLVCLDCRVGGKGWYPQCVRDSHRLLSLGARITVPKKNNDAAWKCIESGDIFWDSKKVAKNPRPREWRLNHVIWNSPEWKKKQAERLLSRWL